IERKFNLPALTLRDANANHLGDCLVSTGPAPFATPPTLAAAPFRTEADSIACEQTGSDPLPSSSAPEVPLTPLLLGAAAAGGGAAAVLRKARRGGSAAPANPV
ncbi:MAG: hypothetical protein JO152_13940, partial [Mycobacteriaceae bacterium]|nr:hypothetical protein [Mycobacteriaceae bacterium]